MVAGAVGGGDRHRVGAGRGRGAGDAPLEEMDSPAGRPVAEKVRVAPDGESVAVIWRAVMAVPETLDWVPGLVTATVLVMVQVKVAVPW